MATATASRLGTKAGVSADDCMLLLDSINDCAISLLDPAGHVTTWNVGAERISGFAADEIVGRHFSRLYTTEEVAAAKPERELAAARRAGRFEDEGWRSRKDGTRFWARVTITALRDDNGDLRGYGEVTRELSARQPAASPEQAALQVEQANRVKDEFLATVSHELRAPLTAIVGYAGLLRVRPSDTSLIAKASEVIQRNADAQVRMVDEMLDLAQIDAGQLRLDLRPTDLVSAVKETVDAVRPSAEAKRVSISVHVPQEPAVLVADGERIRQVVWNLLANAVKFTDARGAVSVDVERAGSYWLLSVRDTGSGIDPSFLPSVFEPFRQADSSTIRRFGGLGLGLAIVRRVVELHGGTVEAQSAGPGSGASFRVALPVQSIVPVERERNDGAPPVATRDASTPAPLSGVRVLVVDDEADAREMLKDALTDAGATVDTADSADAGFAAIRQHEPDMLISDIGMPGQDGYALVRRVRALAPAQGGAIPAIALTAYTRSEDRTRALAAGFTTHVDKPVNPEDLIASVAHLAALVRSRRPEAPG